MKTEQEKLIERNYARMSKEVEQGKMIKGCSQKIIDELARND